MYFKKKLGYTEEGKEMERDVLLVHTEMYPHSAIFTWEGKVNMFSCITFCK